MPSRRKFIRNSAIVLSATPLGVIAEVNAKSGNIIKKDGLPLELGVAGYTFVNYSLDQALMMMNRVNIKNLSIKEFHLPLNSTQEVIDEVKTKCSANGINIYTVGVIYMKTEEEVDRAFAYAKKVGVHMIVGVPGYDVLPYTEQKVKEYNIRIAIHNHGPEDKLYPGPKDVYDRIKNMDERVGLCLDIGHAFRAGTDLNKALKEYGNRIFDLHMKDVTAAAANAKVTEIGRGAIDFPSFMQALHRIHFKGMCSIEYEKDMKDSLPGLAESVGFLKGVMSRL